jgi:hypothetical protein
MADEATKRRALDLLQRRISDALLRQGESWRLAPSMFMLDTAEGMQRSREREQEWRGY